LKLRRIYSLNLFLIIVALIIILQLFHARFGQFILKLQSQALTTILTPLKHIPFILINQKYYITHFYFDNISLIKQKLLIRKFSYILFHDEKIFI